MGHDDVLPSISVHVSHPNRLRNIVRLVAYWNLHASFSHTDRGILFSFALSLSREMKFAPNDKRRGISLLRLKDAAHCEHLLGRRSFALPAPAREQTQATEF